MEASKSREHFDRHKHSISSKGILGNKNYSEPANSYFSHLISHPHDGKEIRHYFGRKIGALLYAGHIHPKVCEDAACVAVDKKGEAFLGVFDGMSGGRHGDFASVLWARTAQSLASTCTSDLRGIFIEAESRLLKTSEWASSPDGHKPACASCIARIKPDGSGEAAWFGDCRAYIIRTKPELGIQQITADIPEFWKKSAIKSQTAQFKLGKDDVLILTTDGLSSVTRKEIALEASSSMVADAIAFNLSAIAESRQEVRPYETVFKESVMGQRDDLALLVYIQG